MDFAVVFAEECFKHALLLERLALGIGEGVEVGHVQAGVAAGLLRFEGGSSAQLLFPGDVLAAEGVSAEAGVIESQANQHGAELVAQQVPVVGRIHAIGASE